MQDAVVRSLWDVVVSAIDAVDRSEESELVGSDWGVRCCCKACCERFREAGVMDIADVYCAAWDEAASVVAACDVNACDLTSCDVEACDVTVSISSLYAFLGLGATRVVEYRETFSSDHGELAGG
jgi:hypothetical protein